MTAKSNAIVLASALVLSACGQNTTEAEAQEVTVMSGKDDLTSLAPAQRDLATRAVRTLADKLDIPVTDVKLDTIRAVNWRDSSIGCPQPDQAYGQVITPGYKITLRVGKAFHFVHAANERMFVCESAGKTLFSSVDNQRQLVWGEQMIWARKDLASKLGLAENAVIVRSAQARDFDDASLDCPQPGIEYATGTRKGFVLTLSAQGRDYTYHTDLSTTILCPPISVD